MRQAFEADSDQTDNQEKDMLRILNSMLHVPLMAVRGEWQDETGQTMVEYVMLIVLVALAVFLLAPNIKSAILAVFSNTSSALG